MTLLFLSERFSTNSETRASDENELFAFREVGMEPVRILKPVLDFANKQSCEPDCSSSGRHGRSEVCASSVIILELRRNGVKNESKSCVFFKMPRSGRSGVRVAGSDQLSAPPPPLPLRGSAAEATAFPLSSKNVTRLFIFVIFAIYF